MKENLNIVKVISGVMSNKKFYTYAYLREDRTPYYIGKGEGKRLYEKHKRRGQKDFRPKLENGSINKNRIIYLKKNITEEEAFKHEIYMISVFGRKDLKTGILINMTDGGDGLSGFIFNEDRRNEISKRFSKSFELVSPNLELVLGHHIGNFCEKYNLTQEVISQVLSGKRISHKGWTHPDRPLSCKIFYIRNPKGKLFCFGNIDEFCNKNNLSKTNVYNVMIGRRKFCNNGWHSLQSKFEEYKLLSPEGKLVIWNTSDRTFCSKYGLHKWLLFSLVSGEIKQTNGWTLYDNPIKKYKLLSPKNQIVEFINIAKFSKENDLSRDSIGDLLRGKRNEYKGWTKP